MLLLVNVTGDVYCLTPGKSTSSESSELACISTEIRKSVSVLEVFKPWMASKLLPGWSRLNEAEMSILSNWDGFGIRVFGDGSGTPGKNVAGVASGHLGAVEVGNKAVVVANVQSQSIEVIWIIIHAEWNTNKNTRHSWHTSENQGLKPMYWL